MKSARRRRNALHQVSVQLHLHQVEDHALVEGELVRRGARSARWADGSMLVGVIADSPSEAEGLVEALLARIAVSKKPTRELGASTDYNNNNARRRNSGRKESW